MSDSSFLAAGITGWTLPCSSKQLWPLSSVILRDWMLVCACIRSSKSCDGHLITKWCFNQRFTWLGSIGGYRPCRSLSCCGSTTRFASGTCVKIQVASSNANFIINCTMIFRNTSKPATVVVISIRLALISHFHAIICYNSLVLMKPRLNLIWFKLQHQSLNQLWGG